MNREILPAMSQENVDIMREMFALVNERGVKAATDAFAGLLDADFELEEAANLPDQERYAGRDAFIANMAKLEEAFDDLTIEPIEFVDLGDKLIVVVAIAGRGRAGGAPVETTIAQLWTLRKGKAVSLRDYGSKAEALEAAGSRE
jgi:ketosteroid isomerase-like protein